MNVDELVRMARPASDGWAQGPDGGRVLRSVVDTPVSERKQPRWRAGRWSFTAAGLVAASAVVALAITLPPGTPPPPDVGTPPASQILLAAAQRAETVPDEGRYWRFKTVTEVPVHVGGNPGYDLTVQRITERWDPRDPATGRWVGTRTVGARPATEADERAWRAAGSPIEWNLGPGDSADGRDRILAAAPDAGSIARTGAFSYLEDLGELSLVDVSALPDDPQRLRGWVDERIRDGMGITPGTGQGRRAAFEILGRLLLDVPATSEVRAAAFRAMAQISGLRGLGEVSDSRGRAGLGVEYVMRDGPGTYRSVLIVDPDSHLVVERVESSSLKQVGDGRSTVVLAAEWSDATPTVPSLP